jgi:hypothetical protein
MVDVPASKPQMMPVEPMAAIEVLEEAHVPPVVGSVRLEMVPEHSAEGPEIFAGNGFTVMVADLLQPRPVE